MKKTSLAIYIAVLTALFLIGVAAANVATNSMSNLCSNRDGWVWSPEVPLPESGCANLGYYVLVGAWPYEEAFPSIRFFSLQELKNWTVREEFQGGVMWFEADLAILCSNTDGWIWNQQNPLPEEGCANEGRYGLIGAWPYNGTYELTWFPTLQELKKEAKAQSFQGGVMWFEEKHDLFLPLAIR